MQNQLRISKGNLDGRRWTTAKQTAWLETHIPAFTKAQGGSLHVRSAFWVKVYQGWVAHWPVEAAPPSLDSPTGAAEISTAAEEHTEATRVLKMVCAYIATALPLLI
jgi:hypothetical protein